MELTLSRQVGTQVVVTCDGQPSHTFDLPPLPDEKKLLYEPDHSIIYGKTLYAALFPPETLARCTLATTPERLMLVTTDPDLDAIPWEYAYGPDGFLVLDCHFVRGLPAGQRVLPPALQDANLHIVAVPSNPLSHDVEPLDIDGEWMRLRDIVQEIPESVALERTRPPSIEQVRHLVAGKRHRVVHFMGHGGRDVQGGAILCFEQDNGDLAVITAREFVRRVRGSVFLITLNACKSASPGETHFSNLAAALVRQKIPYALGMRFNIYDDDARAFSREFYGNLARGTSVEEALLQARLTLAHSKRPWVIGTPVLYTALAEPAAGFAPHAGTPVIIEHQPRVEAGVLPRAEGTFQGRIDELKVLGTALTSDSRPRIITIHGGGGQGKTALAREAAERFAYAWPTGVWITTLENLPNRAVFVAELARFLGINPQEVTESAELERQVLLRLASQRTLIVLDNAETMVEAVEAKDAAAIQLAQLIQQLPGSSVSLLVTSRLPLGFSGEMSLELGGLLPEEGAALFLESAPQRSEDIDGAQAQQLSQKLDGHPLGLLLLSKAFNESAIPLQAFISDYEAQLLRAENKYIDVDHRHRTLYACIDTSVRYLTAELRTLFSKLWIFHAPFQPGTAVAIFNPPSEDTEHTEGTQEERSPIHDQLHTLWRRSLLIRETVTLREGTLLFYRLLPTMHPYVEQYLAQKDEREALLARFGSVYARLANYLYNELDRQSIAAFTSSLCSDDFERGILYLNGVAQGYYLLFWGWLLKRLGDTRRGLELTEKALKIGQGQDLQLELHALNNLALLYQSVGDPRKALELYEQALQIIRMVGDRAKEAATLSNIAQTYDSMGQSERELELYEQALSIMQEIEDQEGEVTILNNIATVYQGTGQARQALKIYEQILPRVHETRNRVGVATTLNNMAAIYDGLGESKRALELYGQTLSITQEMGDRTGEAIACNNMAAVYRKLRQPQQAMELYKQALLIKRAVGDQSGEVTTLNGMTYALMDMQQYPDALKVFDEAISLDQQLNRPASMASGLVSTALLLYQYLKRPEEAIVRVEQAIAALIENSLSQDTAEHTVNSLQRYLNAMRQGISISETPDGSTDISTERIQQIITTTISVMTTKLSHRTKWREAITNLLLQAQRLGKQVDLEFFSAILVVMDGQEPVMPPNHPYAQAVMAIQAGIAAGGPQFVEVPEDVVQAIQDFINARDWKATRQVLEAQQALLFRPEVEAIFEQSIAQAKATGQDDRANVLEQHLVLLRACKVNGIASTFEQFASTPREPLPFDTQLVPRSIRALLGGQQEKMEHMKYLATLSVQTTDEEMKALVNTIRLALFGSDPSQLGQNLKGVYRQAWEEIVVGVEQGGM